MTRIESNTVRVKNTQEEIFLFLRDLNNFIQLLPQEKVTDWKSDKDSCSFRVQGAVTIPLIVVSDQPNGHIHIKSGENAPFPFTLDININLISENECEGNLVFNGDMNAFLRMMAVGPLTNLFNYVANKLVQVKSLS